TPALLEAVRVRIELGSTLARMGRRVEARDALRPALADADAVGALLLAQRARRELVAPGLRPRQAALEGAAALTPRQRQICELAAAGKGNRAIAQELFLSIKTVETHLAAAFRKLGISGRDELAAELAPASAAHSPPGSMCGLFARAWRHAYPATLARLEAPDSGEEQSRREPDGYGIGYFDPQGRPHAIRRAKAAYEDRAFAQEAHELRSRMFIAHIRFATTGANLERNTHPF